MVQPPRKPTPYERMEKFIALVTPAYMFTAIVALLALRVLQSQLFSAQPWLVELVLFCPPLALCSLGILLLPFSRKPKL